MPVEGYKLFWGTFSGATDGVHPVNPAYNSGVLEVQPSIPLPNDFWHDSFYATGLFLRVAPYEGTAFGPMSKEISIASYGRQVENKLYPFSFPRDDGQAYTTSQLKSTLNGSVPVSVLYWRDPTTGRYRNYMTGTLNANVPIGKHQGVYINCVPADIGAIVWCGKDWED